MKSGMPACPPLKSVESAYALKGRGAGIGTQILDYLKYSFTHKNKTGCRFLLVDAYKESAVLRFYEKNGFKFLTDDDAREKTRIMYFDLALFKE